MTIFLSPGVRSKEIDLTLTVAQASSSEAAFAGQFNWGPVDDLTLVTSETDLVNRFGKPTNNNASDWFTVSNYLAYANKLFLVRVVDDTNADTALRAVNASVSTGNVLVKNREVYSELYADGELQTSYDTGPYIAKYAGANGNALRISVCPSASAFSSSLNGTVSISAGSKNVVGTNTTFTSSVKVGDVLIANREAHKVASITSDTVLTLSTTHRTGATNASAIRKWEFYNEVNTAPGTSPYVSKKGGSGDEMHIIIQDTTGVFSGQVGTILEKFQYVSKASDGLTLDGQNNFYKDVLNNQSQYVWWAGFEESMSNIGDTAQGTAFDGVTLPLTYVFAGGADGADITENEKIDGYDFFLNKEDIDISLILGGEASTTLAVYLINNIAEIRQDCVVFLSPPRAACVNNKGNEAEDIVAFRNTLPSTSYAALDGNWKYQYDRYNDLYRYVPCNGDVAGIHARTDDSNDPWWAAAGLNRGNMKNVIRLAWNPKEAYRDQLYVNGVNPVVIFKNEGAVLFGQKTLLSKPSAFDRLNVRRLFNVLKKSISRTARYYLFEFNDDITRLSFKNTVEPFLRDVKGRRGITAFYVKIDAENNTPYVIDNNMMIGSIFVKPNRVAEGILLNFVAVPTGTSFEEVVQSV